MNVLCFIIFDKNNNKNEMRKREFIDRGREMIGKGINMSINFMYYKYVKICANEKSTFSIFLEKDDTKGLNIVEKKIYLVP